LEALIKENNMSLSKKEKQQLQEIVNAASEDTLKAKTILVIKSRPILKAESKGATLNDGYEFEVDGAIPEIADGIAKFAKELPNQGCGKGSDRYFINLIGQYFDKL